MSKEELKAVDKTAKQKANKAKAKRPNLFVRIGRKIKEVFSELKKVSWPTFNKVLKDTGIVIAVVLLFLVVIALFDMGLTELLSLLTGIEL
ncbi:MAG: preprotein translocase subunit SecE [Clostridiales bacterium]|nr:preprotein translocase subunit SecE [Clostridiales bacterium]